MMNLLALWDELDELKNIVHDSEMDNARKAKYADEINVFQSMLSDIEEEFQIIAGA